MARDCQLRPEQRFNRRWGLISVATLLLGAGLTWLSFATGWPGV